MDESLRDQIGRIISEHLAEGIDICNSNDIDIIADEVMRIVPTGDDHNAAWFDKALGECIKRLDELGELKFDSEDTACWYWDSNGKMLGRDEGLDPRIS